MKAVGNSCELDAIGGEGSLRSPLGFSERKLDGEAAMVEASFDDVRRQDRRTQRSAEPGYESDFVAPIDLCRRLQLRRGSEYESDQGADQDIGI